MPEATDAATAALRRTLQGLNVQRESLEHESAAVVSELTAVNPDQPLIPPMGVDTPLVDAEGYPRNDIDVFRARTLRQRLAEIRTDHQKLMRQIESHLHQLALQQNADKAAQEKQEVEARQQTKPKPKFDPVTGKWVVRNWDGTIAGAGEKHTGRSFDQLTTTATDALPTNSELTAGVASMNTNTDTDESGNPPIAAIVYRANTESTTPFCRVESVALSSPAAAAGLRVQDEIIALGPQCAMTEVAILVRTAAAENATIELRVGRRGTDGNVEQLLLQLKPRPWSGRGLLGCHIVPIE